MTKKKEEKKQQRIAERWKSQSVVPIDHGQKKIHKRKEKDRNRVK